jgi:predicted AlkP superfamily pyrophosphatase or phosphodiesterase
MNKVILILIDGLGFQTSVEFCGYLEARVAAGTARRTRIVAELPSMSRPLYETVHTGVSPVVHGITANDVVRTTRMPNIFGEVRKAGGVTVASAFSWFSELYNQAPFDRTREAVQIDAKGAIQHGVYYETEAIPDREVFQSASAMAHAHSPDYMLLHPMASDHIGHKYGGDSKQYRTNATKVDTLIAEFAPGWEALGYRIMVTADHGMNADGYHGGSRDDVRHIAFYDFGSSKPGIADSDSPQTAIAPTILTAMRVSIPSTMQTVPLPV